jgi:sulfur relay (sulfurtransferase) complex TusBCD TusD component (DsrE family)
MRLPHGESLNLTRRRGGAEETAEKRQLNHDLSADSAISGLVNLNDLLRASASPRERFAGAAR